MNKIYFDLDGVMANFEKMIVELAGVHYWDRKSTKFWTTLEKADRPFLSLDLLPGALDLFNTVMDIHGPNRVEILTACPEPTYGLVTAEADKREWVYNNVNQDVVVNAVVGGKNKYKWLEENPGTLLIDDYARNIESWIDNGGIGILHVDPDSTAQKLKILGVL